jgi:hypothetical protein
MGRPGIISGFSQEGKLTANNMGILYTKEREGGSGNLNNFIRSGV